jgi:hypothetical protein
LKRNRRSHYAAGVCRHKVLLAVQPRGATTVLVATIIIQDNAVGTAAERRVAIAVAPQPAGNALTVIIKKAVKNICDTHEARQLQIACELTCTGRIRMSWTKTIHCPRCRTSPVCTTRLNHKSLRTLGYPVASCIGDFQLYVSEMDPLIKKGLLVSYLAAVRLLLRCRMTWNPPQPICHPQ